MGRRPRRRLRLARGQAPDLCCLCGLPRNGGVPSIPWRWETRCRRCRCSWTPAIDVPVPLEGHLSSRLGGCPRVLARILTAAPPSGDGRKKPRRKPRRSLRITTPPRGGRVPTPRSSSPRDLLVGSWYHITRSYRLLRPFAATGLNCHAESKSPATAHPRDGDGLAILIASTFGMARAVEPDITDGASLFREDRTRAEGGMFPLSLRKRRSSGAVSGWIQRGDPRRRRLRTRDRPRQERRESPDPGHPARGWHGDAPQEAPALRIPSSPTSRDGWTSEAPIQTSGGAQSSFGETIRKARSHWAFRLSQKRPPSVQDAVWGHNPIEGFILARLKNADGFFGAGRRGEGSARDLRRDRPCRLPRGNRGIRGRSRRPTPMSGWLTGSWRVLDMASGGGSTGWTSSASPSRRASTMTGTSPTAGDIATTSSTHSNHDKPFDRFMVEQIAGDELAPGDREVRRRRSFTASARSVATRATRTSP